MFDYKIVWTIIKKEFKAYFNNPTGYVLLVPFLLLGFFLYFRSILLSNQGSMRPFMDLLPYLLLFLAPAIAMRTFSQEQKNKTQELLFAHPISELEIVLGKFFAALSFYLVFLGLTLGIVVVLFSFSTPDPGIIIAQYLGAIFIGGAFLAIGIAAATYTTSQVASFLLASAVSFVFILIGFDIVLLALPHFLAQFVTELAILPHVNNLSRGLLDLRDILYFFTLISVFLLLAINKLSQRKLVEDNMAKQKLNVALGLLIGIAVILNIFMVEYPVRLDITIHRLFTLSTGTKKTLQKLPDIVTINVFASTSLPGPEQVKIRQIKDLLSDYKRYGKSKLVIKYLDPDTDTDAAAMANEAGVQKVQFRTVANNSFAAVAGYEAVSINYSDQKEIIPFIQDVNNLEYQLTRKIYKLVNPVKIKLGIFTQTQSYNQQKSISTLRANLQDQYALSDLNLSKPATQITQDAVLVYGLTESVGATASSKLTSFAENGGKLILLLDSYQVSPQSGTATPYSTDLDKLIGDYGITLNQDIAFDRQLNEYVTLGTTGGMQYLLPYPFWPKAIPADPTFVTNSGLNSVSMAWPDSLTTEKVNGVTLTNVLQTSPNGGVQTKVTSVMPSQELLGQLAQLPKKQVILAVAAQKDKQKIAVVGDSDFIDDRFIKNNPDNLHFISSLIDWVAANEIIASIKPKADLNPPLIFADPSQALTMQYLNLFGIPLVITLYGIYFLKKRKKLTQRVYK